MPGAIPPASWPSEKRAICLEIPDTVQWVALVTGLIQQLSFGYYWDKDYSNWEDAKAAGQEILQSWMKQIRCDAGAVPIQEPQCVDYPNSSPMLDWQPANPFLDPSRVPPGYVAQPWGVVGDPPVFPYQAGDVISGLFGLPVLTPALGQGLARVRVKFTGQGTVEVHLIKVALGGIALLTWDDNPLTAKFIDTSMDFLALPPESGDEDIQEITFSTPGDHHIDVTMLPRFGAEVGFAGYGGGIRKIVLCGPDMQFIDRPGEEFTSSDNFGGPDSEVPMAICEALRWNNGVLEGYCCGEWVPVVGGGAGPAVTQPVQTEPLVSGDCQSFQVTLGANQRWLMPMDVQTGDIITVISPTGAWSDGTLNWFCPDGKHYLAGSCTTDVSPAGSDPVQNANHMSIIVGWNVTTPEYSRIYPSVFAVPDGVSGEQLWFQANDDSLGDNSGSLSFTVQICRAEALPIGITYTFGTGPSSVADGGVITITSGDNSSNQRFHVTFGECVHVEVLSSAGWISEGSTASPAYIDCASATINHSGADVAPEVFLANVDALAIISNGAGVTHFTSQVRITRIP